MPPGQYRRCFCAWVTLLIVICSAVVGVISAGGTCSTSYNIAATTCAGVESAFKETGCTCYTCNNRNGEITAECASPFACEFSSPQQLVDANAVVYENLIWVYVVVAFVLAVSCVIVTSCCFPEDKDEPTIKAVVRKRMCIITRCVYDALYASFVRENGTALGVCDFFCLKRELFGLIDCRKKAADSRSRGMRLVQIIISLMITFSLALVLGTVDHNNELCIYSYTVESCITPRKEDLSTYCLPYSSTETRTIGALTAFLTMVMAKANSIVLNCGKDGSRRQKLLLCATIGTAIGLLIFGLVYSNYLNKQGSREPVTDTSRVNSVGIALLTGWAFDQIAGSGLLVFQWMFLKLFYSCWYRPKLEAAQRAGVAVVHPRGDLNSNVVKDDGVKDAASSAASEVKVEEVRLQPPMQGEQH